VSTRDGQKTRLNEGMLVKPIHRHRTISLVNQMVSAKILNLCETLYEQQEYEKVK
jgi:hypothetical protein